MPRRESAIGDHPIELTVSEGEAGSRLDQLVVRRLPGISRGSVRRLLERRQILVDGHPRPKGTRLSVGQQVLVASVARGEQPQPQPELALEVIAVLPEMVVVNKAAGMPCHPLVPGETETVANALAARFPECVAASPRPREGGLVHRLDWCTSGVLLAARTPEAYGRLRGMFSSGAVVKHYLALAEGRVEHAGQILSGLRAAPRNRGRMLVYFPPTDGRAARTEFSPLEQLRQHTLLHVVCRTGQRHQVRAHLAHAGHPLAGDEAYGGSALQDNEGAFLHAARLELVPDRLVLAAPLSRRRCEVLRRLGASILQLETI